MKLMLHPLVCTAIFIGLAFSNAAAQNCNAAFSFDGTDITIHFFDESTSDPGDPIVSWFWDFDDGTTSNEQNPEHTFPEADNYAVILTITTQSGCTSTVETEIEICVLNVSLNIGDCDANGEVSLAITVMDPYDAAIAINISIDGQLLPGSPFDIDDNAPVTVNTSIAGDGLQHTLVVQSEGVGTCNETIVFSVPDCSSDCFLGSLSVSTAGGTTHIVDVGDNFFDPSTATIIIGDIVEFQWIGDGHTTTSDATSGPDSWNSGELSFGATYQVDITNPGVHPYYCIPHGGPGGVGMAGTIVANCPASGQFTLIITFNTTQADPAGYNLIVDGNVQPGSPFSYNGTGQQSVQATLPGDGQQHTIEIQDVADPSCTISTTWLAPDCGAAPTCSLAVTATENGACNVSNEVPVDLTVDAINPGNSGFNVFVDGTPDPGNPYTYDASGTTNITIMVAGDGQSHNMEVIDVDDQACAASTTITTTDCSIPCSISNLNVTSGSSVTHNVEVLDFDFAPANITITSGDIVEWVWVGAIDHTATSDATSGPDSWDSGLLGTGATYQSPVLSTGVHPYYCIPHGAPGGTGMAGTITVQANCTNGLVSVNLTFDEQGGSANGFTVLVDGNAAGSYNYGPSGTTSVSVDVAGDGQSHTITVQDADNPNCTASTTITTPDCNASTCQLSATAMEAGGCNASNEVPVEVEVSDVGGSASGFSLSVDGANAGNYSYSGTGTTILTVNIAGDGQPHSIEVTDLEDSSCTATTNITTTDCAIPCVLSNLTANTGSSTVHTVEVLDFDFAPANITITSGDIVEWVWVGAIDHTATSDATSGPDSWDSGLLGTGATYQSPVLSTGVHPYYCIPHGAPGGTGMAGTITVQANCTNGLVSVNLTFDEQGGGANGYSVIVDGSVAGTFAYDASGMNAVAIQVAGDGQQHIITVEDVDDNSCATSTTITTPDCNASTCQLSVTAMEAGGCNASNEVPVELEVSDVGGSASGFSLSVDGANAGNYSYSGTGTTILTVSIAGDGQAHTIEVTDLEDSSCTATTNITTTDCAIPCVLSNLTVNTGSSTVHTVEVLDFDFAPANITITSGDIVEWVWVGAIDHTATSDATSGPDSWDSGLLGTGATYQSPVLSTGVHPYYCIPHGAPGGTGMAGTITVQANCTNGLVSVNLTFDEQGGSANGFTVLVDGNAAGSYNYGPSGTTSVSVDVAGDGQSHTITVQDADNPNCTASTTITTPDCNASTCQLSATAMEAGGCNASNEVPVEVEVSDVGGSASGFSLSVDGANAGNYSYSGTGTTILTVNITGDGQAHTIEVTDLEDSSCTATTNITTTDCAIPCVLSNLTANTGSSTVHTVEVLDFDFAPANITITSGDIVEWVWVGAIDHTATSDATSGPDSWDSGLLGTGATYQSPVLSTGVHPYYCIPHGAPGGTGMAGTITVQANCTNGLVSVNLTFDEQGGGANGYSVIVDGSVAGTFAYDASGMNAVAIQVAGDGQQHIITVEDVDDNSCATSTTITTPDCNASTCQLSATAMEAGGCNASNEVPVEVEVSDVGGSASGFSLSVDGANAGNYSYSGTGTTILTVNIVGDGQPHSIEVIDLEDSSCSVTTSITTTDCTASCELSSLGLSVQGGENYAVREVEVTDFEFVPQDIDIALGDTVRWVWTGVIPHTTTSDATSGPDSWDSGLLDQGNTFDFIISDEGTHPYYCIPHGAPGGIGMAGTVEVGPTASPCTADGMVSVNISFEAMGAGNNGFEVYVDGQLYGTYLYDGTNSSVTIEIEGDGDSHSIEVVDVDDSNCTVQGSITAPDCSTTDECNLSASANLDTGCDANNKVQVGIEVMDTNAGDNGFSLYIDGILHPESPYDYSGSGTTNILVSLSGNGEEREIIVVDVDDIHCSDTTSVFVPQCGPPCEITNILVSADGGTHYVEVKDYEFVPANLEVVAGDTIIFYWTGVIPHTTTSDATSGPNSWDSDLLGQGATYEVVITEAGDHPYYCIPHGGPGGIGMAGNIIANPDCENGQANITVSFETTNGSPLGYNLFLDGNQIAGPIPYNDPAGTNSTTISISGDSTSHLLTIQDIEIPFCAATTSFVAPECEVLCEVLNLQANTGEAVVHTVEVKDFEFAPTILSVHTGETVRFDWTGQIPHTTTSDAASGMDSWDSGLLGQGATYDVVIQNPGSHPYYCIPHGGPGGIGMAGSIEAVSNCENNQVNVQVSFNITSGSNGGYNLFLDGIAVSGSPFVYNDPMGGNTINIMVPGDGQQHFITVQDTETSFCAATTSVVVPDCSASCSIDSLDVNFAANISHTVEVEDFEFAPKDITINLGDTVVFVWTGAIPHTTTSDAASGIDSWDSGLLEQGATYELILQTPGVHPYYCTPHGGPVGIGMAGTITVEESGCENGQVTASMSFAHSTIGMQGYNLYLDGELQSGSPFDYGNSGSTVTDVQLPGDGQEHILVVADAEDESCGDTLMLTTPNCATDCQLSAGLNQTGGCTAEATVPYELIVSSANTGSSFDVLINGNPVDGSPFDYDASGQTAVSLSLPGDSSTYVIKVVDTDSADCSTELTVITPDCTPDCSLEAKVIQSSNCDKEGQVAYQLTVVVANGSTSGFDAYLDGSLLDGSPFNYNGDTTIIGISLPGDGMEHEIIVSDEEDILCADTLLVTTPDCAASCMLGEPVIEIGVAQTHIVDVLDFEFEPKDITVEVGDLIRWDWIGAVPHTVTSDVTSGPDSFNSGLLGQGAIFEHTVQEAGGHPYYCIPHGGPGGIGMAGTITAVEPCEDGLLDLSISFTASNTGVSGYNVFLDGTLAAGSPYNYAADGNNSFIIEVPGDGASHDLLVVDVDMPDCSVQTSFVAPDCEDPCFGFEASFESELDHTNLTANFSSTTDNAVAWAWTFGDGNTSTEEAPSYTFSAEGHYEVCLTVTDVEGCTNTVCDSIFIGAYLCEPAFSFEGEGLDIQFTDESVTTDPISSWSWHLADGTILSEEQHPLIAFDTLGIYELCLTIEAGDCTEDTCMTLDLSDPCLVFIPGFSYEIDANTLSVQFTDLSTGNPDQWLWGFGDGSTSNEQHPTYTYQSTGTYNVCLLVQNTDLECNEAFCQLLDIGITSATEQLRVNQPLLIYPNPSAQYRHKWTIEGVLEVDYQLDILLRMYDAAGQLVFKRWTTGAEVMSINTGEPLSTGIYFVEMRSENAVYRARLVIQ